MEARIHCDTAGAHGIQETIVTVQNLLETRLHGDTVATHGIKEPLVTQRGRLEAMVHCYTADSRRPWGQHGTSWNHRFIGTQRGLMDTRGPLWQSRASWKHGEHCATKETDGSKAITGTQWKHMESRLHDDFGGPHGAQHPL